MAEHTLPLTGERTVPGVAHENYWFSRHVAAYRFAASRAQRATVLDAGCGEGYGTRMLANTAGRAVGADLAPEVVAHARAAYPGIDFIEADLCDLPLPDDGFDLAVSLQVIEHLPDIPRFVAEMARVLRPGAEFICATPNRLTFTPGRDTPVNPFHTREFTAAELHRTLAERFTVRTILGLHHGPRLRAVERVTRRALPDLVLAAPPEDWPRWLGALVRRLGPGDFRLRTDNLDISLDLLAVAALRGDPPGHGRGPGPRRLARSGTIPFWRADRPGGARGAGDGEQFAAHARGGRPFDRRAAGHGAAGGGAPRP